MFTHNEIFYGGEIIADPNRHIKVVITPKVAERMLQHNNNNRTLKSKTAAAYARDMENGLWRENDPNALIFSNEGELVDGQHRLKAVLISGATIPMNVTILAPNTKAIVDRQALRTARDVLKMTYNQDFNNQELSAIRLWKIYEIYNFDPYGFAETVYRVSDEELEQTYLKDSEAWDKTFGLHAGSSARIANRGAVRTAIFAAYKCGVDLSLLGKIVQTMNTGLPDESFTHTQINMALLARNYLLNLSPGTSKQPTLIEGVLEEYIYRAVNGIDGKRCFYKPTWHYTKQYREMKQREAV